MSDKSLRVHQVFKHCQLALSPFWRCNRILRVHYWANNVYLLPDLLISVLMLLISAIDGTCLSVWLRKVEHG